MILPRHIPAWTRLGAVAILLAVTQTPLLAQTAPPALERGADGAGQETLADIVARARGLEKLNSLLVMRDGRVVGEERFRGPALDQPVNIKSASKAIVATMVGRAIAEGLIEGPDQPVADFLKGSFPSDPDPRLGRLTVGNLLSMQAGLERTSGANYGRWVASRNWVDFALSRDFVDEPGGRMLYSTGNSHLLSAILTRASRRNTRDLLQDWFAEPLGIRLGAWDRDPQGIYLGGNNMALSPRALLRFGEMIRNGGEVDGTRLVPAEWIAESWRPRTSSVHSGDGYGYGWFHRQAGGRDVHYAWGYGGQMLYIVPDLDLTVAMTSDPTSASGRNGHVRDLHGILEAIVFAAAGGRLGS